MAFCYHNVSINLMQVDTCSACAERMCDGLYETQCGCKNETKISTAVLKLHMFLERIEGGHMVNLSDAIGVKIMPLTSNSLTSTLVDQELLKVYNIIRINCSLHLHAPDIPDILIYSL